MQFSLLGRRGFALLAGLAIFGVETSARSQNPFAPTTPAPTTPAPAPTTPAAPSAPAANPFAPAAPALTTPPATPPAAAPAPATGAPVSTTAAPARSGGYRVLARGVETTIASPVTAADRSSRHDLIEILAELPTYGQRPAAPNAAPAKNVHFSHDAWGLDFTFKPVRFLRLARPDGTERLVWYMVYHVRNTGEKPFLFIPDFKLESYDVKQTYAERLMPDVVPLIQAREDKNRRLLTTAEITGEIPPGTLDAPHDVWGVATWDNIDPQTDRFSIFVQGLTNAYRWEDIAGAYQAGDPAGKGRVYHYQVLKLNFWRPSDERDAHEEEIRFGIPGEVDYEWFYQ